MIWLWLTLAFATDRNVPADYPSINAALDAADAGDTIVLAAGDYCEDVIIDLEVTIRGAGRRATVIDGTCAEDSAVVAVILGGGIDGTVHLQDLAIDGVDDYIPMIVNDNGTLVAERVDFVRGAADGVQSVRDGGGVLVQDAGGFECTECLFCANQADIDGGGVFFTGSQVIIRESVFVGNGAVYAGGALYIDAGADAVVEHNTFVGNASGSVGQALRVRDNASAIVNDNIFALHDAGTAIDVENQAPVTGGFNLFYLNGADVSGASLSSSVSGDPMFTSSSLDCDALDLTLQYGSAAIGQASPSGVFDDIGAFDFDDDADDDGYRIGVDCDDNDPAVNPGADETCTPGDDDCNGLADDDDPGLVGGVTWYGDLDQDGYGDDSPGVPAFVGCQPPDGAAMLGGDCDDADPLVNPAASEQCDGEDNDCDGVADEIDPSQDPLPDQDGDGVCDDRDRCVGDDARGDVDGDRLCGDLDCDDSDPKLTVPTEWYGDSDGDGVGGTDTVELACVPPPGFVGSADDCDDHDPSTYPGAQEFCDTEDRDCDGVPGVIDDSVEEVRWYLDADQDGFGLGSVSLTSCEMLAGYAQEVGDCDDADPSAYPGAPETCDDGIDQDCDGLDLACPVDTGDTGQPPGTQPTDTGSPTTTPTTTPSTPATTPSTPATTDTGPGTSSPTDATTLPTPVANTEGLSPACGCQGGGAGGGWLALLPLLAVRRRRAGV